MADDGHAQDGIWPLPKFSFSIDLGDGKPQAFSEISGLETEVKTIEYRHGDGAISSPIKMPGLRNVGNVTLKRGVFTGDSIFWAWFSETESNIVKPRIVIVTLLDARGSPRMTWTLTNAIPVKLVTADRKSEAGEVAIDTLEIAYETLTIESSSVRD